MDGGPDLQDWIEKSQQIELYNCDTLWQQDNETDIEAVIEVLKSDFLTQGPR